MLNEYLLPEDITILYYTHSELYLPTLSRNFKTFNAEISRVYYDAYSGELSILFHRPNDEYSGCIRTFIVNNHDYNLMVDYEFDEDHFGLLERFSPTAIECDDATKYLFIKHRENSKEDETSLDLRRVDVLLHT